MAGPKDNTPTPFSSKACCDCREVKSREGFHRAPRLKDGLTARCKACYVIVNAKYYAENGARVRAAVKKYRKANPDKIRICKAKFERAHPALREAGNARWRKKHPGYRARWNNSRRARKAGAASGDRKAYRVFIQWAKSEPILFCYWCHKKTPRRKRHVDHIIPLSRGGADAVENLCVACPSCNLHKADKMPEEFSGQAELKLA